MIESLLSHGILLLIIVCILCNQSVNKNESFATYIPPSASDEYMTIENSHFWKPYRTFDWNKIESKQGNMINNSCTQCVQTAQPYYDKSVDDFKHVNYNVPIGSYNVLRSLNPNIALNTCPRRSETENKIVSQYI